MEFLCNAIVSIYSTEYLKYLTSGDLERLLKFGARQGYPRMLGSLNCMHWKGENCKKICGYGMPTLAFQDHTMTSLMLSACYYGRANLTKVTYKQIKKDIITKTH
jgi:hypothetical protein